MADVGLVVDGRPAHVHRHPARVAELAAPDRAQCGVVQAQHASTVAGSCRAPSPKTVPGRPGAASGASAGRPTAPTASTAAKTRDQIYSIDTPPADGERVAARRPRVLLHPHRHHGPLQAHAGPRGLLPDGLGRQRAADRAAGPELLRGALRSVPAVRPRASCRPPRRRQEPVAVSRPNFVELCLQPHRRGREGLRGAVAPRRACRSTGPSTTPRSGGSPSGRRSGASCASWPGARPTPPRRRRCGTSTSRPPSPRPSSRTGSRPAPSTGWSSTDRAAATCSSTPPGRSCCPPAWRWSPIPTTPATVRLFGSTVTTPLFGVEVPVMAHELADPDKGTGMAMICTFGDVTDVVWWRELGLPVRSVVGRDGRLVADGPSRAERGGPGGRTAELAGQDRQGGTGPRRRAARASPASWTGEPQPINHAVKFYEKGDRPLEIVTSRQWFIRTLEHRDELLRRGKELRWHPPYMQVRYEALGRGPQQRLADQPATVLRRAVPGLVPARRRRPSRTTTTRCSPPRTVCRSTRPPTCPAGYTEDQRGQPGGFVADPDVMDTWATSSLTPQIAARWEDDPDLFGRLWPMDLRPQAHDIIRTWLFSTIVRAHLEFDRLPWSDAAISGWILDPDRKKMSKSKGNVVTPMGLLEQYGSDAVRYWAASARPGTDTAFDEGQMKIGRRLAIKLLNASKFVLGVAGAGDSDRVGRRPAPATRPSSSSPSTGPCCSASPSWSTRPRRRSRAMTTPGPSSGPRAFFWSFCDDYVELVKSRSYGTLGEEAARSAHATLRLPCRCCCGCSRRSCPSSPRRCGRGGGQGRSTGRRGRQPRRSAAAGTERASCSSWPRGCSAGSARPRPSAGARCERPSTGPSSGWPPSRSSARPGRRRPPGGGDDRRARHRGGTRGRSHRSRSTWPPSIRREDEVTIVTTNDDVGPRSRYRRMLMLRPSPVHWLKAHPFEADASFAGLVGWSAWWCGSPPPPPRPGRTPGGSTLSTPSARR